jgi:hypothetical protein
MFRLKTKHAPALLALGCVVIALVVLQTGMYTAYEKIFAEDGNMKSEKATKLRGVNLLIMCTVGQVPILILAVATGTKRGAALAVKMASLNIVSAVLEILVYLHPSGERSAAASARFAPSNPKLSPTQVSPTSRRFFTPTRASWRSCSSRCSCTRW